MLSRPKRKPLVTSVAVLRALAVGITMLSLGGMTIYAGDHLRNSTAPLQPSAARISAPVTPTTTRPTTGRIQLSAGVPTTTARPVTTTHRS